MARQEKLRCWLVTGVALEAGQWAAGRLRCLQGVETQC